MENECEALPGVSYPGVRDNRSTINTKTGYDDDDDEINVLIKAVKQRTFDGEFTLGINTAQLVDSLAAVSTGVVDSAVGKAKCGYVFSVGQVISFALVQLLVVLVPVNRRRRLSAGDLALQRCLLLSLGCLVSKWFSHFRSRTT